MIYNHGCIIIPDEDKVFLVTAQFPTGTEITNATMLTGEDSDRWKRLLFPILSSLSCFFCVPEDVAMCLAGPHEQGYVTKLPLFIPDYLQ